MIFRLEYKNKKGLQARLDITTPGSSIVQIIEGTGDPFKLSYKGDKSDKGDKGDKGDRLELTIGKIDLFGFFDQNAVASDEATQFLNNVFVHNPLLDSGGDIAADAYGFAPGVRAGYYAVRERFNWGASLGLFASARAPPSRPGHGSRWRNDHLPQA